MKGILQLHPNDNVYVACRRLAAGETLATPDGELQLREDVEVGHKIASRDIPREGAVLKYGAHIGSASRDLLRGDHVHLHNMRSDYLPSHLRGGATEAEEPVNTP